DARNLIEALEAPEPELPDSDDFVGRQREMAELRSALDAAMAGRGQMVMLSGEPGIGKTRLARELASRAKSLGAQVMWGWCYEHVGAPPYWPFVQPIRTYAETVDAVTLSSQMGLGGPAIAEIVPELRAKLPELEHPVAAEPDQARFRLFDSMSTFLKNLAQGQPLLFIVDDLHWADSSSLLMLEFLVREIAASPVLVLGTYRDAEVPATHPMSQTLGNLVRERHFRRVQLSGLTREEVGEFVEGHKGVNLSGDILEMIHSRTEGNPLFVNEVVELIDTEQMAENRAWADVIPEGVRDAIGSRLSRLSPRCNQVLGTASVMGREFDLSLLRSLDSDIGADEVLAALDEALIAKVIEELPAVAGRYQFGHALIQQSLYGELSSVRRLRTHASIAEALERMHGSTLAEHAAELARHFAEAQSLLGPEKLARYSLMAGEQALENFAYEEASAHFERALVALQDQPMDLQQAQILHGLGRAQVATLPRNQIDQAVSTLTRALDFFADSGDVESTVAVAAIPIAGFGFGHSTGIGRNLERALALVEPESLHSGRLLSRYGRVLGMEEGNYELADDVFGQALKIARELGDAPLELRTLTVSAGVDTFHLHMQVALDKAKRAIELAIDANDLSSEVPARFWATQAWWGLGDLSGFQSQAEAMLEGAERLRDRYWLASALWRNEWVCASKGEWSAARAFNDRGLEVAPLDHRLVAWRIISEYQSGDFDRGMEYVKTALDLTQTIPVRPTSGSGATAASLPLIDRITGGTAHSEIAGEIAKNILASPAVAPRVAAHARTGLGLIAAKAGDCATAEEIYSYFNPIRQDLPMLFMATDRLLGLLSLTLDDMDNAVMHFEDAISFCRSRGYRPELAWTCRDYAEAEIQRGGDRSLARSLLDEALAISSELEMPPLIDQVKALLEQVDALPGDPET
ncbi:MAG: AAA family ATPase, partial [Acidobacteriota bacterium]